MSNKSDVFVCDVQDDIIGHYNVNGNGKNFTYFTFSEKQRFNCGLLVTNSK